MSNDSGQFPQYLCRTCGRCCKSITTSYSYEQLKEMAAEGEEEAKVFIEIFKRFPDIEAARKVVPEQVDQIFEIISQSGVLKPEEVSLYYCPHLTDQGLCSIYEKRPDCCKRAPRHGWTAMPPGCGFEGWQFEQREAHKKTVRFMKEYLYTMEMLSVDGKIPGKDMTIDELRKDIEKKIEPWSRFGSKFW